MHWEMGTAREQWVVFEIGADDSRTLSDNHRPHQASGAACDV